MGTTALTQRPLFPAKGLRGDGDGLQMGASQSQDLVRLLPLGWHKGLLTRRGGTEEVGAEMGWQLTLSSTVILQENLVCDGEGMLPKG